MIPVSLPSHELIQIYCSIPWGENSNYLRLTTLGRGPEDGDEDEGMGVYLRTQTLWIQAVLLLLVSNEFT